MHCLSRIFTQHGSVNLLWDIWQCIVSALHCLHSFFSWHLLWLVWRHQRILVLAFRMGLYLNIFDSITVLLNVCGFFCIELEMLKMETVGIYLWIYIVSQPKRTLLLLSSPPWESQVSHGFFCYCVWYFIGTRIRSDCHVKFFYTFFRNIYVNLNSFWSHVIRPFMLF